MNKIMKDNLESLSKDQLMKVIEEWYDQLVVISETCVSVSKLHISDRDAFDKIRECLSECGRYNLNNTTLSQYIDMQLGKITPEEYRKILLRK